MAELKRREDQLTTADLAGRTESENVPRDIHTTDDTNRPKLVRNEGQELRSQETRAQEIKNPGNVVTAKPTPDPQKRAAATPLFSDADIGDLRGRWSNVQTGFVDEPRHSVEEADKLVAAVMQRLAEGFAKERSTLEKQWDRGDNVSTEDLRVALQRYRSFFDRLLNA